jgi:hypothetical protein
MRGREFCDTTEYVPDLMKRWFIERGHDIEEPPASGTRHQWHKNDLAPEIPVLPTTGGCGTLQLDHTDDGTHAHSLRDNQIRRGSSIMYKVAILEITGRSANSVQGCG